MATVHPDEEDAEPGITKEEYKDMVNTYGLPSDMWEQSKFHPPQHHRSKQDHPLAPRLVLTPEQEQRPPYAERQVLEPEDEEHREALRVFRLKLRRAVGTVRHWKIWVAYQNLRTPRPRYLTDQEIRTLFSHLTWSEFRHSQYAKDRYLELLEECAAEHVELTVNEWSSAIDFVGRAVPNGTSNEVKDAIGMWLRMEETGIKADHVTFNILFYTAVKAGRFALADTIYNELRTRNMELDRYFRISMIYYAGARGNGDGVRKAFNDMVNAGEIVDVTAMNCVILSLFQAGEPEAAEHVFLKMKDLHETKFGIRGPNNWRSQRKLAKLLNKTSQRLRSERQDHESSFFGGSFSGDDKREAIQRASPIAPTARTYRMLLRYHTRVSGNMTRIQELLAECKELGFHTHGSVYLNLFVGFHVHGGYAFTAWKPSLLEEFWQEFLDSTTAPWLGYYVSPGTEHIQSTDLDPADDASQAEAFKGPEGLAYMEEDEDDVRGEVSEEDKVPYFTKSMAIVVVKAFHKCCGRKRMREVWADIQERWKDASRDDIRDVDDIVEEILRMGM